MEPSPGERLHACLADLPGAEPEPPIRTGRHAITLLPEVDVMLRSILHDIEAAKERVFIECYIYRDDALGRAFGDVLARAASRGVPTCLIYDPLGSQRADGAFFDDLRARGVDVHPYRDGRTVLGKGSLAPRDHSRIMVVDGAAYTGGAAWADEWLPQACGGEGWHDVCVRVAGPCVADFARAFEQRRREADAEVEVPVDVDTKDKYADVRLVADTPKRESLVYLCHRDAVRRAKRRVWIENAYFFPSVPLLNDLYEAAARGVDVAIMLPGVSDLAIVKRAAYSEYPAWLRHGLRLWEYRPRMNHAKLAVVDDDWCTIGTFNANPSSLALANEVNLFVFDPVFVQRVARLFEADRAQCDAVTEETIRDRPLLDRVGDSLANNAMTLLDVLVGHND